MAYAPPRLTEKARGTVFKILIDEFGSGNPEQSHIFFYQEILREFGMPDHVEPYLDETTDESYAFVNIYHWLTRRAPQMDFYLGAILYSEASITYAFQPYQSWCMRHQIRNHRYFSEHIHIDVFHTRAAMQAIRYENEARKLNFSQVVIGALLAQKIATAATRAALNYASQHAH